MCSILTAVIWSNCLNLTEKWYSHCSLGFIAFHERASGIKAAPCHTPCYTTHTHTHTHTRSDLHTALATLCLSWPAANCEAPNQLTMQQPGSSHSQKTNKHTIALYLKHSHVNIMNYCTAHTQNILGATHRQSGLVSQHIPNPELEDETLVCLSGMAAPFSCRFKTTMLFFFFFFFSSFCVTNENQQILRI